MRPVGIEETDALTDRLGPKLLCANKADACETGGRPSARASAVFRRSGPTAESVRHSCRSELTRQGISLP